MKKTIHWFNLVPDHEDFCRDALAELSATLKEKYSTAPEIKLERISPSDTALLSQLPTFCKRGNVSFALSGQQDAGVFGFCAGDEPFVKDAQSQNSKALWGAALAGDFALAWKPNNKYLIWHECLHLLFAQDCYDGQGVTICEEPQCIMQYAPSEQTCNGDLVLCECSYSRITRMNAC